jgi:hypothetical protein
MLRKHLLSAQYILKLADSFVYNYYKDAMFSDDVNGVTLRIKNVLLS